MGSAEEGHQQGHNIHVECPMHSMSSCETARDRPSYRWHVDDLGSETSTAALTFEFGLLCLDTNVGEATETPSICDGHP